MRVCLCVCVEWCAFPHRTMHILPIDKLFCVSADCVSTIVFISGY